MAKKIQLAELPFPSWGGARPGAGRPKQEKRGASHARRPALSRHHPVHVTIKLRRGLPRLRRRHEYEAILGAFNGAKDRFGFRLNQFAVMNDHLHLIVEAQDKQSLSRGIKGLVIRVAKALNAKKHIQGFPREALDAFSSARWFDGWLDGGNVARSSLILAVEGYSAARSQRMSYAVVTARTWLQRLGWRRHGLIGLGEVPRS